MLDSHALLKPGYVKTSSRVQKWWLTTIKGYEVEQILRFPKRYSMGRLIFGQSWILRPTGSTTAKHTN